MIHGCPSRKPTRLGEESREGKKGSCETNAGALHKCCFSNQARVWPSQKRIAPTSPQHPQQVHLHTSLTTRFCNCMLLHIVQNEITKAFEIQVQMQTFPFQDVLHRTIHYKAFVLQMMFMFLSKCWAEPGFIMWILSANAQERSAAVPSHTCRETWQRGERKDGP